VTGGAGGIGAATAERFAAEGALVGVLDLSHEGAQAVAGRITRAGGTALTGMVDRGFGRVVTVASDAALLDGVAAAASNPEKLREAFPRAIPMGRIAEPADLPGAICFFASDEAGFITGHVLSVSGGLTMSC